MPASAGGPASIPGGVMLAPLLHSCPLKHEEQKDPFEPHAEAF